MLVKMITTGYPFLLEVHMILVHVKLDSPIKCIKKSYSS
jgi:hypothetical protein